MNNLKILMLKGLPASGKSTYARSLVKGMDQVYKESWKRINKDDLRAMLDDSRWSRANEEFVLFIRDTIAVYSLKKGISVIIDDTNFAPKHEERFRAMAKEYKADFEIKDFTDVSPEECIKRDLARPNSVGSKVIMQMYNQYLKPKPRPVLSILNGKYAIICDLDGTLCLFGNENPYDRDFSKDQINYPVAKILNDINVDHIYFVSGRNDKYREVTLDWLGKNLEKVIMNKNHSLHMRKDGDVRKDSVVKEEIFKNEIEGRENISFVLDDRNQMVEMWRDLGITCLQVNYGDF